MSETNFVCGSAVNCAKSQKIGCSTAPAASSRQRSREICGVRPRSRMGQSFVRCWPGGRRCSSGRAVFPVRKRPSRAQRALLRVSLDVGGWSLSSAISHAIIARDDIARDDAPLLVTMHRRFMLGVAHGHVDNQREKDDTAEIVIEPVL